MLLLVTIGMAVGCTEDNPSAPTQCEWNGALYDDGEVFPAGDGCNSCKCNELGDTPGEVSCSLIYCPDTECPNNFREQAYCPSHCAQLQPAGAVPPFYCAAYCTTADECNGYACHPDGYCVPACTSDFDCQGTFGSFDRCDVAAGLCTFD